MLPMILSFLGSAFAPSIAAATGIGALASPLLMGAIGSGVGTAIEQGDIGAGLKAGLGSFLGGSIAGKAFGGAGGALAKPLPGQSAIGSGVTGMTTGTPLSMAGGINSLMPPPAPAPTGAGKLFGSGALGSGVQRGLAFAQSPQGIGSVIGGALATPVPGQKGKKEEDIKVPEMKPIPRQMMTPPPGYRPGTDPEFNYGLSTPYSYRQITNYRDKGVLPYAEGGEAEVPDDEEGSMEGESERPASANEKTEIVDAIRAIKGQHPQPEIALGKFLAKYGESALRDLVDSVQSGKFDETLNRFREGEKGIVRGPGDGSGKDDKVPATIDGEQDVLLTDGEFVLRKDATDALEKHFGGGFLSAVNKAGKSAPSVLKNKVAA